MEPGLHRFQKWREALQLAPNARAVQGIVRDYVEAIGPLLGVLPADCVRMLLQDNLDIQAAAVTLLQCELRFDGPEQDRALLHEIAHTLAAAAVRITLLHPRLPVPNAGMMHARSRNGRNDEN